MGITFNDKPLNFARIIKIRKENEEIALSRVKNGRTVYLFSQGSENHVKRLVLGPRGDHVFFRSEGRLYVASGTSLPFDFRGEQAKIRVGTQEGTVQIVSYNADRTRDWFKLDLVPQLRGLFPLLLAPMAIYGAAAAFMSVLLKSGLKGAGLTFLAAAAGVGISGVAIASGVSYLDFRKRLAVSKSDMDDLGEVVK